MAPTVVPVAPDAPARAHKFLERHETPSNIHVEEELEYEDKDHRFAHGHEQGLTTLARNRTLSISQTDLYAKTPNQPLTPEEQRETFKRRRRGSHDEKVTGKPRKFLIDVEQTQRMILAQEDTDGDFQITVHDAGPKSFVLGTANSGGYRKYEIRGTYMLSNLLQELALAADYGRKFIVLDEERLNENPLDRLSRLIKFHFWDGLTRRIDAEGLEIICNDPKNRSKDQRPRIFVPFHDQMAWDYYNQVAESRKHLQLDVVRLPEIITPQYVKSMNFHPGILSLGLREAADPQTGKKKIRGTPFVVPGGRFNEMYGWDSYFEALGLLVDGRIELARGMVENFVYEIEHYGKILNANRSYYLTRSQPPFLTDMIWEVYRRLPEKEWTPAALKAWLAQGHRAAVKELLSVWMAAPRLDPVVGLSKFHPEGLGMPPETEASHFNHILEPYAEKMGISLEEYMKGYMEDTIKEPELDRYFVHDRAVRESGHDTTYRFEKRCANLATIDLNSLVYKYDVDLARIITDEFNGCLKFRVRRGPEDVFLKRFLEWYRMLALKGVDRMIGDHGGWESGWAKGIMVFDDEIDAEYRAWVEGGAPIVPPADRMPEPDRPDLPVYTIEEGKFYFTVWLRPELFTQLSKRCNVLIDKYLWNPKEKLFFDYDCALMAPSTYHTVTALWALWAGHATQAQADALVPRCLQLFEVVGGLVSGTEESRGLISIDRPNRQWDYPYGWAPHQILAWPGLEKYGFLDDARRVAYRWLYTIVKSFVDFNGVVPEKFDVVNMTHKVNVEYGNVGADFRFVVREGFGWMNASFQLGLKYMTKNMRRALGTLTPPDQLFTKTGQRIRAPPAPMLASTRSRSVSGVGLVRGSSFGEADVAAVREAVQAVQQAAARVVGVESAAMV
ncbi:alpha,alpha-trehalase nth1 [Borealophlyctis nickersoniae]|nr:alpha,alpha-trehalase nth1 [Borealophlyctis nickersoniae]